MHKKIFIHWDSLINPCMAYTNFHAIDNFNVIKSESYK